MDLQSSDWADFGAELDEARVMTHVGMSEQHPIDGIFGAVASEHREVRASEEIHLTGRVRRRFQKVRFPGGEIEDPERDNHSGDLGIPARGLTVWTMTCHRGKATVLSGPEHLDQNVSSPLARGRGWPCFAGDTSFPHHA